MNRLCSTRRNENEVDGILKETLQRYEPKFQAAQKEEQPETVLIQVEKTPVVVKAGSKWILVAGGQLLLHSKLQLQNGFSVFVSHMENKLLPG